LFWLFFIIDFRIEFSAAFADGFHIADISLLILSAFATFLQPLRRFSSLPISRRFFIALRCQFLLRPFHGRPPHI